MCTEFIEWWNINWLTIVSIIVSGMISLIISAIYYHLSNRINLKISVIFPSVILLQKDYSVEVYKELCKLASSFQTKYMTKKEKKYLIELLPLYKEIMNHEKSVEYTDCIFLYFDEKLLQKNVNSRPIPIEYDDEIVDYDYPLDVRYFRNEICEQIKDNYMYGNGFGEINLQERIKEILNHCIKECYSCEKIDFFSDYSLYTVLEKSEIRKKWRTKYDNLENAKNQYLELNIVKNCRRT